MGVTAIRVSAWKHWWWNPLRCAHTAMPVDALIVAKVLALTLLLRGYAQRLPDQFVSFLPALEAIPHELFRGILRTVFVSSALMLLFNLQVRFASAMLGTTLLVAILANRLFFSNNIAFCGLLLVFAGLTQRGAQPRLMRLQVSLVFFAAGLDKLLTPAWRSGTFLSLHAAGGQNPHLAELAAAAPSLPIDVIASWITILGELALGVLLLIASTRTAAMAGVVFFECVLFAQEGSTFGMFFFAATVSMVLFMRWPDGITTVIYRR